MKESPYTYAKLILFAIKNKRIIEFVDLKWQKDIDRWQKKHEGEYNEKAITAEMALAKIFPNISNNSNNFSELENHIDNFIKIQQSKKYPSRDNPYPVTFGLDRNVCRLLYYLCTLSKPDIVIETGVANGFSSSYILLGLDHNNRGKLISIDYLGMPWHSKEKVGLAIPMRLKKRHELKIGKSIPIIKELLQTLDSIDIFIHDSSHTYKYMMNEFEIAWPYIKNGGFLLADDVSQNDAFLDFANKVNSKPLIIKFGKNSHFGILKK